LAIVIFAIAVAAVAGLRTTPVTVSAAAADDPSTVYKTKCAMCHGPKSEKFYDPAKSVDEHVDTVMKGKKGEKPPFMPGFEAKGMTRDEAKGLVEYMQGLRQPK
jgi:mono/diheme cytochrome c family protein